MELISSSCVIVPHGWQRLIEKNSVIYVSPNQSCLRSRDEVVRYLSSSSTCKCGLKCPFSFDEHFSFDPNVIGLPDSRPFTGYSNCTLTPNLYLNNRNGRKKLGNPSTRKGGMVTTKLKTSVSAKGKSKMEESSCSNEASLHSLPPKPVNISTKAQPKLIITATNSKSGEVSYLNFHSLIKHLNNVAKSATGIVTPSCVSLPIFVSAQHMNTKPTTTTTQCVSSLSSKDPISAVGIVPEGIPLAKEKPTDITVKPAIGLSAIDSQSNVNCSSKAHVDPFVGGTEPPSLPIVDTSIDPSNTKLFNVPVPNISNVDVTSLLSHKFETNGVSSIGDAEEDIAMISHQKKESCIEAIDTNDNPGHCLPSLLPLSCTDTTTNTGLHHPCTDTTTSTGLHQPSLLPLSCTDTTKSTGLQQPSLLPLSCSDITTSTGLQQSSLLPLSCSDITTSTGLQQPSLLPLPHSDITTSTGLQQSSLLPLSCSDITTSTGLQQPSLLPLPHSDITTSMGLQQSSLLPLPCTDITTSAGLQRSSLLPISCSGTTTSTGLQQPCTGTATSTGLQQSFILPLSCTGTTTSTGLQQPCTGTTTSTGLQQSFILPLSCTGTTTSTGLQQPCTGTTTSTGLQQSFILPLSCTGTTTSTGLQQPCTGTTTSTGLQQSFILPLSCTGTTTSTGLQQPCTGTTTSTGLQQSFILPLSCTGTTTSTGLQQPCTGTTTSTGLQQSFILPLSCSGTTTSTGLQQPCTGTTTSTGLQQSFILPLSCTGTTTSTGLQQPCTGTTTSTGLQQSFILPLSCTGTTTSTGLQQPCTGTTTSTGLQQSFILPLSCTGTTTSAGLQQPCIGTTTSAGLQQSFILPLSSTASDIQNQVSSVMSTNCSVTISPYHTSPLCSVQVQSSNNAGSALTLGDIGSTSSQSCVDSQQTTSFVTQSDSISTLPQYNSLNLSQSVITPTQTIPNSVFIGQIVSQVPSIQSDTIPPYNSHSMISPSNISIPELSSTQSCVDGSCEMKSETGNSETILDHNQSTSEGKITAENTAALLRSSTQSVNYSYNNNVDWTSDNSIKENIMNNDETQNVFQSNEEKHSINQDCNIDKQTIIQDNNHPANGNDVATNNIVDSSLHDEYPCKEYNLRKRHQSMDSEYCIPRQSRKCIKSIVPGKKRRRWSGEGTNNRSRKNMCVSDDNYSDDIIPANTKQTITLDEEDVTMNQNNSDFQQMDEMPSGIVTKVPCVENLLNSELGDDNVFSDDVLPVVQCPISHNVNSELEMNQTINECAISVVSQANDCPLTQTHQTQPDINDCTISVVSQANDCPLTQTHQTQPDVNDCTISVVSQANDCPLTQTHQTQPDINECTISVVSQANDCPLTQNSPLLHSSLKSSDVPTIRAIKRGYSTGSTSSSSDFDLNLRHVFQQSISSSDEFVVRIPLKFAANHRVIQCYSANTFKIGDVVWAKAETLPGWPAKIIFNTDWTKHKLGVPPPDHVWVSWYESPYVSLVKTDCIKPLHVGCGQQQKIKKKKQLGKAIKKAMLDLSERQQKCLQ